MLRLIVRKVFWKAPKIVSQPVLLPRHRRVTSVRHVSLGILQDWRMERSNSPPEMHALDHLARHHTKAFV